MKVKTTWTIVAFCSSLIWLEGSSANTETTSAEVPQSDVTFTKERPTPPFVSTADPPLQIKADIYIEDVTSFNVLDMEFRVDYFLVQNWTVQGVTCKAYRTYVQQFSEAAQVWDEVRVQGANLSRFWVPDTFVTNSKNTEPPSRTHNLEALRLRTSENKCRMIYTVRRFSRVSCQMQFKIHPFDTQMCPMIFRSYAFSEKIANYTWLKDNGTIMNPDLRLLRHTVTAHQHEKIIVGMRGINYSVVTVRFIFSRHIEHYILQVFAPSAFIVVISWFSFWLGYENTSVTDRITLCITGLLTLVTQFSGFRQELPPVSYITGVDVWMSGCLIFIFLVILETVIGSNLSRKWKSTAVAPVTFESKDSSQRAFRRPFSIGYAVLMLYPTDAPTAYPIMYQAKPDGSGSTTGKKSSSLDPGEKLDRKSQVVLPVLYLFFTAGYFAFYVVNMLREYKNSSL